MTYTIAHHRTATVDGINIFYRDAGPKDAPALLLLHGFPTSSHMFRNLIPALADRYHVVAPDLPGFGFSDAPPRDQYRYTFDNLARTIGAFTDVLRLERYVLIPAMADTESGDGGQCRSEATQVVGLSLRVSAMGVGGAVLAQRFLGAELDAMGVVDKPIEDGVGDAIATQVSMPVAHG